MPASRIFVISGPSGVGKGTLVSRLSERIEGVWVSVSATTRSPRGSEVDGVDYHFITEREFEQDVAADGFAEWAHVHSDYYGTPLPPICQHVDAGDIVILEIDVQGGFQVREKLPDVPLIFIAPPSMEVLEHRLRARGTDSDAEIAKRMDNAAAEMEASARYDTIIVNDDLDEATDELVGVIQSSAGLTPQAS